MTRIISICLAILCLLSSSTQILAQNDEEAQINTALEFYSTLTGDWTGSYSLWLRPGSPAEESEIHANIKPVAKNSYYLMTYSWARGKQAHEGIFLLGGKGKSAAATWGDSFHSAPGTISCKGELQESGEKLILNSTYSVGDGPDWGWRTEFAQKGPNSLLMEAYNISPEGQEDLAVRAVMERVQDK